VRVRQLLANPEDAADFWIWADSYGREGRLSLITPPGPIEQWEITGVVLTDGTGFALDVPVWATIGRTDLTLRLQLTRDQARGPRVGLEDMHVL
jgi:hypothetical protein